MQATVCVCICVFVCVCGWVCACVWDCLCFMNMMEETSNLPDKPATQENHQNAGGTGIAASNLLLVPVPVVG